MKGTIRKLALGLGTLVLIGSTLTACAKNENEGISVGLITKQEQNAYWVTMREAAKRTAREEGIELLTATGESDVDVEGQAEAFQKMVADGVDGILIAPTDSAALNPLFEDARNEGVIVITVDTPVIPDDAADAYFGTDNKEAGQLIGEYAASRVRETGEEPRIALLNLAPGIRSGEARKEGFLEGFGISESSPEIVASVDTQGDREQAREAMAEILAADPDISVIYAINEEAAFGAIEALEAAGIKPGDKILVTVDGSCEMMRDGVRAGKVAATAMQLPENMAREGIYAIIDAVHSGTAPSGFLDTGVQLVSGTPTEGVDSRNVEYGIRNCWG